MATPDPTTTSQPTPLPTPVAMQRGLIAIVDDEEQISRALCLLLKLKQIESVAFRSAEAMLEALELQDGQVWLQGQSARLPVQFAVIDLNLPGISGVALAHRLREMAPQLGMVIMTAAMPEERALHGPHPEGVGCLIKPFRLAELESVMFQTP